jgi:hypothetical protein
MVFVKPDWSDLQDTIEWLEEHPEVAEGIARRQRDIYTGKGYLSRAAEMCYWRELIHGWSQVARVEDGTWDGDGISFELYSVSGRRA